MHGDKVSTFFFPFIGRLYQMTQQQQLIKQNKDIKNEMFLKHIDSDKQVKLMCSNMGDQLFFLINDPDLIKEATIDKPKLYEKVLNLLFIDLLFEQGLFVLNGEKWKNQRKLMHQFFEFKEIKIRIPEILRSSKELCSRLLQKKDKNKGLLMQIQICTGDVICRTFFGEEFSKNELNGNPVSEELAEITGKIIMMFIQNPWTLFRSTILKSNRKADIPNFLLDKKEKVLLERILKLRTLVYQDIDNRIANFQTNQENKKHDFLQVQIRAFLDPENKSWITKDDIYQQFMAFYFAGMDTTAHTILIVFYLLGEYQQHQKVIRDEIDQHCPSVENIDNEIIKKLQKLDCFIKEALRLFTPIPTIVHRRAIKDHTLGEFQIKKGQFVDINLMGLMNDKKAWGQGSDEFKPERWESQEPHQNQFDYIPFMAGERNCIGQHMANMVIKVVAISILKKFQIVRNQDVKFSLAFKTLFEPVNDNLVSFKEIINSQKI